ncbi:MAG: MFS transporter [Alphaproteobacteria bacterium]|nr:MFS transporter [Alphaproteobacteria bacterium]
MSGNALMITLSALVGSHMLSEDKALVTLPVSTMVLGTLVATLPASFWMRHVGRRLGFMTGAAIGFVGGITASVAIYENIFWLFCLGTFLMGSYNAFGQYYRFAAADTASVDYRARAISYVMAGGVVSALFGPKLAFHTHDLIPEHIYLASYASLSVLATVALVLLSFIRIPRMTAEERRDTGRPWTVIVRQPVFIVAVLSAVVGYGSMSLVMTATPLAMALCNHDMTDIPDVIQWHALGMFAPSFVTGHLIRRFGVLNIIGAGCVIELLAVLIDLHGVTLVHFYVGLLLLGVGWNFMFVGGTTLVTEAYRPSERAKTQALNDFLVFGSVAASSFVSGYLFHFVGWSAVNYTAIPFIATAFAAIVWLSLRRRAQPAAV